MSGATQGGDDAPHAEEITMHLAPLPLAPPTLSSADVGQPNAARSSGSIRQRNPTPSGVSQPHASRQQEPEVICLDSPISRPTPARAAPSARKMRRLNDSTPVIVVDDDDDVTIRRSSGAGPASASRASAPASSGAALAANSALPRSGAIGVGASSSRVGAGSTSRLYRRAVRSLQMSNPANTIRSESAAARSAGHESATQTPGDRRATTRDMPALVRRAPGPAITSVFHRARPGRSGSSSSGSSRISSTATRSSIPARGRVAQVQFRVQFSGHGRMRPRERSNTALHTAIATMAHSVLRTNGGNTPRQIEFRYITGDALPDYETLVRLDEQYLRQRNAAPKNVIEKLPEIVATETDKEVCCVVCMCDVCEGEKLRKLPCGHKYHKECIDKWLTYNACCPVCKERICDYQSVNRGSSSSARTFTRAFMMRNRAGSSGSAGPAGPS